MAQSREEPHKEAVRMISKRVGAASDTAESGPARLHAPGKSRPVEAGPARLVGPVRLKRAPPPAQTAGRSQVALAGETREAGPARMIQRFTR